MPILTLRDQLYIDHPGDQLEALQQLATYERIGRLRKGQRRTIRYWRLAANGHQLVLPRGLVRAARQVVSQAMIRDERLVQNAVAFGFRADLRDYQQAALRALVGREGGVLVMAPAAGKTRTALAIAAEWQQPTLFLVHTLRLVHKTVQDAKSLYTLPRGGIGWIADGHEQIGTHFTVATIQTLSQKPRLLKKLITRIGTVVVDECHHTPAESFTRVISAFPAKYRLGLSATPDRDDGLGGMVYAILGEPVKVRRDVLAERGVILHPTIYLVATRWMAPPDVPYADTEEARAKDPARNVLIARLVAHARNQGQRILVLVEREIHASLLAHILTKMGIPAYPVMGRLPTALQDQRFHWMETGKAVVVATKLANEGLDWPALDCVILATPGRSPTVLEQRTGRIARMAPGKTEALVYDLVDYLAPTYAAQAQARFKKYTAMGYPVRRFQWPKT